MLKVVLTFASNRSDQEDLLQEITIAIWNSIEQFRSEAKESTWIYKVSLYAAVNWSRQQTRRRLSTEHTDTEQMASLKPNDARQEWLLETIRVLPVGDRTLLLSLMEGYTHAEIAELIGLSENAVSVRIHRIKKNLTKLAKEHFDDVR